MFSSEDEQGREDIYLLCSSARIETVVVQGEKKLSPPGRPWMF